MSTDQEPDWISAPREVDRQFGKWAAGAWLACIVIALLMVLSEQLERPLAMRALTAVMVCASAGSLVLWRRSEKGSLSRGFSSVLGFLSLFGAILGVIQWA